MIPADTRVELYLAPESTGIYDWVSVTPKAADNVSVRRGVDDLSGSEPAPGKMVCTVRDPSGNLNPENPMGLYFGSIGIGTQQRAYFKRAEDTFTRTETNTWGSVGNSEGDAWTNGSSSGGTVAATNWTVSGGTARHSVPATSAYRVSEFSKTTKIMHDAEVRFTITSPTANVTGTGAIATEVWFRTQDVLNYVSCSLAFLPDETLSVAFYDRTAGINRYLMNYTVIPGLSLGTTTIYNVAAQLQSATMRIKVWASTDPEPMDWQLSASGADDREGYLALASFVYSGNTNTLPLVFQYDNFKLRLPVFAGELTGIEPIGDDKSSGAKQVTLTAYDIISRLSLPEATDQSMLRRARTVGQKWTYVDTPTADSGTTNSYTVTTAALGQIAVGDRFFLSNSAFRVEDTMFTVRSIVPSGGNSIVSFTPDARTAVEPGYLVATFRNATTASAPVVYWPMEDGDLSSRILSGLPGGSPMSISGSVDYASYSEFRSSKPILKMNNAEFTATVPNYDTSSLAVSITFLLGMPSSDEAATNSDLIQFYTTGTGYSYEIQHTTGGGLRLIVADSSLNVIFNGGPIAFNVNGVPLLVKLVLRQVGGQVQYQLSTTQENASVGVVGFINVTGVTSLGRVTQVRVNPAGGYIEAAIGHLALMPTELPIFSEYYDMRGWNNQASLRRLLRVCYEENIPFCYRDSEDVVTMNMGRQYVSTVWDLIKDVPGMDFGFLTGAKGAVALEYITRGSLHNQSPVFTLHGGASGHIAKPFTPIFDNSEAFNLVTVERVDGSTASAELTDGRLSTALPPNGLGRRERKFTLSLGNDGLATTMADWQLSVGTIGGPRITRVSAAPAADGSITIEQLSDMDIGRRIDLDTLNTRNIYGTMSQVVAGYTLNLADRFNPEVEINTIPYAPYNAFALTGDDNARPDAADSVTSGALNSTDTGPVLTVESTSEQYLWTTGDLHPSDFPLDIVINGEVMTISDIAGESPMGQSFTISARSVNGVVKSHAAGSSVHFYAPNRFAAR